MMKSYEMTAQNKNKKKGLSHMCWTHALIGEQKKDLISLQNYILYFKEDT